MKKAKTLTFFFLILIPYFIFARDIFIREGSNGNGSRENPLGTIHQAFTQGLFRGDRLFIAEGRYFPPPGQGGFIISRPGISFFGGFNSDFSQRDPWKFPSLISVQSNQNTIINAQNNNLSFYSQDKELRQTKIKPSPLFYGEHNHQNTIIDGLIFDAFPANSYLADNSLNLAESAGGMPALSFYSSGVKLRNCGIFNSAGPGVRIQAKGKPNDQESWPEIKNCLIINCLMYGIEIRLGSHLQQTPEDSFMLLENNTILLIWPYQSECAAVLAGGQSQLNCFRTYTAFIMGCGIKSMAGSPLINLQNCAFYALKDSFFRYFNPGQDTYINIDDPAELHGTSARRRKILKAESRDNFHKRLMLALPPGFGRNFYDWNKNHNAPEQFLREMAFWEEKSEAELSKKAVFAPPYDIKHRELYNNDPLFECGIQKEYTEIELPSKILEYEKLSLPIVNYKEGQFIELLVEELSETKRENEVNAIDFKTKNLRFFKTEKDSTVIFLFQEDSEALLFANEAINKQKILRLRGEIKPLTEKGIQSEKLFIVHQAISLE